MSGPLPSRHDLASGNHSASNNNNNQRSVSQPESPIDSVGSVPPTQMNLPPVSFEPPAAEPSEVGSCDDDCLPPPPVGSTYSAGDKAVKFKIVGDTLQPSRILSNICRNHCFRQHIEVGAYKWSVMTQMTKNKYWGEFLKYAKWENVNPETIYRLWEKKTRACYRDYLGKDVRNPKKAGRPRGCGQTAYDAFKAYWDSEDFKKESAINKDNRTRGGEATATYHGGCKGIWQWTVDLAKENKPSDPHSVMKHCYTRKHDGKTFTNKRGKKIDTRYEEEFQKLSQTQSQSQTDSGSSSGVVEKNLYKQVAMEEGGVGHGRIFGTGSSATIIYGEVNKFGPPEQTTPQVPPEYVSQLNKCQEETAALKENEKRLEESIRLFSQQLTFMSQFICLQTPPPQTQMQGMNFTQMLGSQTHHPFFQGAGGPMQFGHTAAAGVPFYSPHVSAAPIYSQAAPAAPTVPQIFQAPSSVAPNATPSWANNLDSAAVEDLARELNAA